jgi:exocyst complex component 3
MLQTGAQKNYIKEETLERLKVDEEVLGEFFRDVLNPAKVDKRVQPLAEIRELASAESVDAFTLAYTNLLQNHPDCPPEVVEKLVALREGIPRKDAKEVCNLANSSDPSMVDGPEANIRYY